MFGDHLLTSELSHPRDGVGWDLTAPGCMAARKLLVRTKLSAERANSLIGTTALVDCFVKIQSAAMAARRPRGWEIWDEGGLAGKVTANRLCRLTLRALRSFTRIIHSSQNSFLQSQECREVCTCTYAS